MVQQLKFILCRLQQNNDKALYLAMLRIMLCSWFLIKYLFRWPVMEQLYSNASIFSMQPSPAFAFFNINLTWLQQHYQLIAGVTFILLILNLLGIGRYLVALLLFLMLTVLHRMNDHVANGGDSLAQLLAFYLVFANSYSRLTLFKQKKSSVYAGQFANLLSNLVVYSILFNLCLVYFMAGLHKLADPYWQQGSGLYYFLHDKRYLLCGVQNIDRIPYWVLWPINYAIIICELLFPFLVWFRRSRNIILILGLIMHGLIFSFLMIYGMSVIFVIQYGLFYTNQEISLGWKRLRSIFHSTANIPLP